MFFRIAIVLNTNVAIKAVEVILNKTVDML